MKIFELQALLQERSVDIIFLGINMPEMSGLDLLKSKDTSSAVVLTTAHSEYALDGFDLGVIDYLLKPFTFPRFQKAIDKIKNNQAQPLPTAADLFLQLKCAGLNRKINYQEILFFESLGNYVKVRTGDKIFISIMTMKELEASFHRPFFIRIHKSYIVPLALFKAHGNLQKIRIQDKILPVGRKYKEAIRKLLEA